MVRVRANQKWFTEAEVSRLLNVTTDELRSLARNKHVGILEKAAAYRAILAREFAVDLEFASTLARRLFLGTFLFNSVPARMIQFMRRSPRFRDLMQDLFAGTQPYLELRGRVMQNLSGTLREVLTNLVLNRVIPESSRAGL